MLYLMKRGAVLLSCTQRLSGAMNSAASMEPEPGLWRNPGRVEPWGTFPRGKNVWKKHHGTYGKYGQKGWNIWKTMENYGNKGWNIWKTMENYGNKSRIWLMYTDVNDEHTWKVTSIKIRELQSISQNLIESTEKQLGMGVRTFCRNLRMNHQTLSFTWRKISGAKTHVVNPQRWPYNNNGGNSTIFKWSLVYCQKKHCTSGRFFALSWFCWSGTPPKKTNSSLDRSPISSGLGKYAHKRWHHVIITAGNGPAMKLILHTLRC